MTNEFTNLLAEHPFRAPQQFLTWFDAILDQTRDPSLKRDALLHKGPFKRFYEEVFPLAMLLKHKCHEWADSRFRNCNVDFDAEVSSTTLGFSWIEITSTFQEEDFFRMRCFLRDGQVSMTGDVRRDPTGRPIAILDEPTDHQIAIESSCAVLRDRIERKCTKSYSPRPALLVYYDDWTRHFDDDDYRLVEDSCRATQSVWSRCFVRLFAVGPKPEGQLIDLM